MVELPKAGDRVLVEKFHVSECNVRFDEPFGETQEDKQLIAQLRFGKVVQPFKARPEEDGYGVYLGRRRFLAKQQFTKQFVVGTDCLIVDIKPEKAREESLIENLQLLQKNMDSITRARNIQEIVTRGGGGIRATARRLGIKHSTLIDWLKPLELNENIQNQVKKGLMFYKDALKLARMKLPKEAQDKLSEAVETGGREAFLKELTRFESGKMKRGVPKDKYFVLRMTFDKRWKEDMKLYDELEKRAKDKDMKLDVYVKWLLSEHVKIQ